MSTEEQAYKAICYLTKSVKVDTAVPGNPVIEIELSETSVVDSFVEMFSVFSKLKMINLYRTHVDGTGFKDKTAWQELHTLHMGETELNDDGVKNLAEMPKLQYLDAAKSKITDTGLSYLEKTKSLKTLIISDTGFTPKAIADLQAALPGLKIHQTPI